MITVWHFLERKKIICLYHINFVDAAFVFTTITVVHAVVYCVRLESCTALAVNRKNSFFSETLSLSKIAKLDPEKYLFCVNPKEFRTWPVKVQYTINVLVTILCCSRKTNIHNSTTEGFFLEPTAPNPNPSGNSCFASYFTFCLLPPPPCQLLYVRTASPGQKSVWPFFCNVHTCILYLEWYNLDKAG